MTVERFGISMEPELLARFDKLMRSRGYMSRSEFIRDLTRKSLLESDVESGKGNVIGTLTIVYDHNIGNVADKLLHLQHHHHEEIMSSVHIHMNEQACLEVLIIRGKTSGVRKLADNIKALKGIKHGELVITKESV
ncbi:MAG: nickel-responsive transcriptional regulator NikR [Candidatus Aenigmatarchaeota archaeon]|nr:MAG: nickel-responsive transcriptional regulator NikR [Candidatus Aenigmarchaeota archaeon]